MAARTGMRLDRAGNGAAIHVLVRHPMRQGGPIERVGDRSRQARYITRMRLYRNDVMVAEAQLGPGVSDNPLVSVRLDQTRVGDRIAVDWQDNVGDGERIESRFG